MTPPIPAPLKVSVAQMQPVPHDLPATLRIVVSAARKAAAEGSRLIAFPEMYLTPDTYETLETLREAALVVERGDLDPLLQVSAETGIHIVVGFFERDGNQTYNTAALIGPQGLIGLHHKRHLPLMPGDCFVDIPEDTSVPIFDTDIGRIGLAICYEIRFPEVTRTLALEGADIIVLPAAWPEQARILPDLFSTVRANENLVYFMAPNRNDAACGMPFIGNSHIIDPLGNTLVRAGAEDGIFTAEIDIARARNKSLIREPGVFEVHPFRDRLPATYRL
ncbi:carbon-nitrogen hydrolase family protein [Corticimicrobacter populi]|uniref:Carbon-nitrogen hydrolase family protein n=1 Tax=Corticimicrobacter populi TaxID=2175229 RepID=A0A2V1JW43_9BURK|nr:carbon-nitrogen hydrolase family protein [Corticimicrobacter populi]PWF22557.1 carbon-nitrogen hydrolase family protein [Corticimicrobacter populi]